MPLDNDGDEKQTFRMFLIRCNFVPDLWQILKIFACLKKEHEIIFDKNFCPHIGGCGKSGRNLIAFPATHEGGPPHPDGHQISADH